MNRQQQEVTEYLLTEKYGPLGEPVRLVRPLRPTKALYYGSRPLFRGAALPISVQ